EVAIEPWLAELRNVARLRSAVRRAVRPMEAAIDMYRTSIDIFTDVPRLREGADAVAAELKNFSLALPRYLIAEKAVADGIKGVVDAASETTGWQELIDLAKDPAGLRAVIIERSIRAHARKELEEALKQIDKGNEEVWDAKFQELSTDVATWWDLLRPGEMSFFAAVKPRPGARR